MSKEIDIQIEKFQKLIDNPKTTDEERERYTKFVEKLKVKKGSSGEKKDDKKPAPKKDEKKPTPKKEDKKPAPKKKQPANKKPRGVKVLSTKRVSIDGKEMDMDSKEFCDYLLAQFKVRREKSKSTGKKKKTTSVMSRVNANIEKGVVQAVKAGIKDKKKEIEKNPKPFIKKVEKLETSTKTFLQDLKEVMGSEYDSKEVTSTIKSINDMIDELKKKMDEKKD